MILVVSMLVLLVIIAAAFVSRAQSLRVLSSAQQLTAAQTDRIGPIAHAVTEEIAQSLFVQPIDPTDAALSHPSAATRTASSAVPRINPNSMETRYSIDLLDRMNNFTLAADADGDGSIDGYNFAPYEVRPWTNWPDVYNFSPVGDIRNVEGNPLGNPSFGDSRWLRSTEPIRLIYDSTAPDSTPADSDPHPDPTLPPIPVFSHWSHLSWIPTANNGWRLVRDISDLAKSMLHRARARVNSFPIQRNGGGSKFLTNNGCHRRRPIRRCGCRTRSTAPIVRPTTPRRRFCRRQFHRTPIPRHHKVISR